MTGEGRDVSQQRAFRNHIKAGIFYLVRGGNIYLFLFFTMLKQMQSHFVRTCEVSNYTEQISAMSHPNIRLVSNEHL